METAVQDSEITFILVPTPTDSQGGFSLEYVLPVSRSIARAIRKKSRFHLIVLTSTVMPGSTKGSVVPLLEKDSGKRCGVEFGLCYSPEFVALGSVIHDFFHPDFLLIGESDPHSGDLLENLYKNVCKNDPPVARMNFVNAEVTKLAVNTFVTTKISYANMLARICERLPEADVDAVTSALGMDSRIGAKYLKGAIGYGGPCFPRDNIALASLARTLRAPAFLAEATDRANRAEVNRLASLIKSKIAAGNTVGILGLSYKANTNVVEESQGLFLAQLLAGENFPVIVFDPAGMENARKTLSSHVAFASSAQECARIADIIVVTTPWKEFLTLSAAELARNGHPRVLIDCWRLFPAGHFKGVLEYVRLGVCL
jgi:UDPglucose 6-dehydrogenase